MLLLTCCRLKQGKMESDHLCFGGEVTCPNSSSRFSFPTPAQTSMLLALPPTRPSQSFLTKVKGWKDIKISDLSQTPSSNPCFGTGLHPTQCLKYQSLPLHNGQYEMVTGIPLRFSIYNGHVMVESKISPKIWLIKVDIGKISINTDISVFISQISVKKKRN